MNESSASDLESHSPSTPKAVQAPFPILWEDNHCLAVVKPAGWLIQSDGSGDLTLFDAAVDYLRERYDKPGRVFLGLIHRLDRNVSGIVLFARTSKAASRLSEQFRLRTVTKVYQALVHGHVTKKNGTLEHWLLKNEATNTSRIVSPQTPDSKLCQLSWRVEAVGQQQVTQLRIILETGRSHQIRVQCAEAGWPLLGDLKYGAPHALPDRSLALHASELTFEHPTLKTPVTLQAPPPLTWKKWLSPRNPSSR